jgi:hypothetical protein
MLKIVFALAISAVVLFSPTATTPAFAAADPPAAAKKEPTPGQIAFRERQKKCAAEWHEAKANNKIPAGMTWPKFWSACNKRLKAQAK